jgi:hypothetical protein
MRLLGRNNVGLTVSLLLASAPAIAQSEDKTESTGMLEEIVVTAQN